MKTHFGAYYGTSVDDGDVMGDELWSPRQNPENYVIVDSYDTTHLRFGRAVSILSVFQPLAAQVRPFAARHALVQRRQVQCEDKKMKDEKYAL